MSINLNGEPTLTKPIDSSWTSAYREALHQGKNVMYACQHGEGRSRHASEDAQERGEKQSFFLESGIEHMYFHFAVHAHPPQNEEARAYLRELMKKNYLRIIEDDFNSQLPEYKWLHEQLAILALDGIQENQDYEFITWQQTVDENKEVILRQLGR